MTTSYINFGFFSIPTKDIASENASINSIGIPSHIRIGNMLNVPIDGIMISLATFLISDKHRFRNALVVGGLHAVFHDMAAKDYQIMHKKKEPSYDDEEY